jgi:predicted nucleic acid-binding protein
MRIFLDANILFSASLANSFLADFLQKVSQHAGLLTNDYAKEEALRNIQAKHPARLTACEKLMKSLELTSAHLFDLEVALAAKDQPILCGAISGKADFLLTGDKRDFGHLFGKTVCGVQIVNVDLLIVEFLRRGIVSAINNP